MASVNKVIILGNLGRDPETRFSGNNLQITSMSVATTSYRRSAETQERVEETEWHRVVLFGRQAEIAQQYLKKGSRVYLEGRLRTRKWEKDGQTHYSTEILADTLQLIDRKSDVVGGGQSYAPQSSGDGFESPAAPRRSEFTSAPRPHVLQRLLSWQLWFLRPRRQMILKQTKFRSNKTTYGCCPRAAFSVGEQPFRRTASIGSS
ncbi:MAG: single-stranded DNA-binding protein [Parasutterella excrementihominis]